jgi:hypothetical protein
MSMKDWAKGFAYIDSDDLQQFFSGSDFTEHFKIRFGTQVRRNASLSYFYTVAAPSQLLLGGQDLNVICAPALKSLPELQGCRALVLAMFTSALTCGPDSWLRIRPYLDLGGIGARLADLTNVIGARSQPPTCAPNAKLPLLQPSPSKASTTISLPSVPVFLASHIILICLTCSSFFRLPCTP